MHCFHRIFKFGLQSLNIFSSKYLKLFGNEMNCKDVQFLNIYKKYLQLETFQLSNALISCNAVQDLNIHEKSVPFDTFQLSNALISCNAVQEVNIYAKYVPLDTF